MKIQGVISDMDGVILDSEKLYVRFWCEAGRFYGFPMEEKHALSIRSMARPLASAKLKGIFGDGFDYEAVRSKRVELMDNYVEKNGIEVKSGAKELLSFLKENGSQKNRMRRVWRRVDRDRAFEPAHLVR